MVMKEDTYKKALQAIESVIEGETDLISAMSTIACELYHAFDYFNWKLLGQGYDGLPASGEEARERVAERVALRPMRVGTEATVVELPASQQAPFTLDLRRSSSGPPGVVGVE